MPDWTKQQQIAIEDRGGTLLLSAAAGSGKTAVLTHRAADILADEQLGVLADRLLIVTFTNAAAAELRARMAIALDKKLQDKPNSSWLRRQKLLLGKASVCTVDSFCMDLLTQHFTQTELPVGFSVLRPAEEAALLEEAMSETLEEAYTDPDFCLFSSQYGKARSDASAEAAITRLFEVTRAMPYPEQWWARLKTDWAPGQKPGESLWGKTVLAAAETLLNGIIRRQQQALELVSQLEKADRAITVLTTELSISEKLLESVRAADWDSCCQNTMVSFDRFILPRGLEQQLADPIKLLRNTAKDKLKSLSETYFVTDSAAFEQECQRCQPMVIALEKAVRRFSEIVWAKKVEKGSFCFYDFEHEALKLLLDEYGQRKPLSLELSEKYEAVMVDEYQDTNDLQDTLYYALAKPDCSNLFFVGDVKQSIYGFRDARPEYFIQKKDTFSPYDGVTYPATVLLSNNFRSTGAVIGSVNDIFIPLMRRETGGVLYDDSEKLVPGLSNYALDTPCEVLITDITPPEKEKDWIVPPELVLREKQQQDDRFTVAQTIAQMLREGCEVRDGDTLRPCRAGDFCILLRSPSSTAQKYADALAEQGIPTFYRAQDSLLADPQVDLLLSFLRILDNPGQDIPLAAVLLSPLFGFTPQNLVDIRLNRRKGSLYTALLHSDLPIVTDFLARLRLLRRRSLGLPVQDICALVLDDTGLYELTGALPGAESSRQNLRLFQSIAAQYAGSNGLAGFLRLVDSAIKNGKSLTDHQGQNAPTDRVQIMSIHGSKGLEFPIVIMANLDRGFNQQDLRGTLLCHNRLGVAFHLLDEDRETGTRQLVPTLAVRAMALQMRQDLVNEEMRLMYVGLTRAKDRLLLSWSEKKPLEAVGSAVLADCNGMPDLMELQSIGNNMSHWLLLALMLHPDAKDLRSETDLPEPPFCFKPEGHFHIQILPYSVPSAETKEAVFSAEPDADLLQTLRETLSAPPAVPVSLPVKVSVSSLAHKELQPVLAVPSFMQKQDKTAAQRGTAMHKFLQLANLAEARKDPDAELARLAQGAYLSKEELAVLNKTVIRHFLQSDLVSRMLTADTLLREYEFIERIPACLVDETLAGTPVGQESVFLLGIADCIILKDGCAELVDYKTDRGKDADRLLEAYADQLKLYRTAITKRLGVPVTRTVIYSLALNCEIEVP